MNILIVDDNDANRHLLSLIIDDLGHEYITAENGEEAVELHGKNNVDIILLDVMMPIMDGWEAAAKIKAQSKTHVPILFLTAMSEQEALIKCLEAGGDDFISKPIQESVLQAKLAVHMRLVDMTRQLSSKNHLLELYQIENEREREVTEVVMNNATKFNLNDNTNTFVLQSAASTFNGDIFLSAYTPSGSQVMMLGDFTGHGLAASIGSLPLSRTFFEEVGLGTNVGDLAQKINAELGNFLPDTMFCAATIIEQNPKGTQLIIWSGGLPDAYIYRADGILKTRLESQHMPLAALESHEFERDVQIIQLELKDRIILHTDGIIEASNQNGDMYGEERLLAYLDNTDDFDLSNFQTDLHDWVGVTTQEDDISLVVITAQKLQCSGIDNSDRNNLISRIPWNFKIKLEAESLQKTEPIFELINLIGSIEGLKNHKDYLYIVLTELYSHALENGMLGLDSSQKDEGDGFVEYYAAREERLSQLTDGHIDIDLVFKPSDFGIEVKILISNSGGPFAVSGNLPEESCDARGLKLIQSLCETIEFSDDARSVTAIYFADRKIEKTTKRLH